MVQLEALFMLLAFGGHLRPSDDWGGGEDEAVNYGSDRKQLMKLCTVAIMHF